MEGESLNTDYKLQYCSLHSRRNNLPCWEWIILFFMFMGPCIVTQCQ